MTTRKPISLVGGYFQEVNTPTDKIDLAGNTTTDLAEGTNLYYTDAKARGAVSVSTVDPSPATGLGSLTYSSSTGVLTFTQVTNSGVRALFSATTATGITYNSGTGDFSLASIPNSSLTNSAVNIIDAFGVTTAVALGNSPAYDIGPAATIIELVRNETGSAIPRGTPVAIVGYASSRPLVAPADANDPTKMPAIGLAYEQIADGSNGSVVAIGIAKQIDTSSFTVGQTLYVSTTPGVLTVTPPTGETGLIQNIGKVTDVGVNGRVLVLGPGRTNAVPNLDSGKIFLGSVGNQAVSTTLNTTVVPEGTNEYFTQARARTSISVTDAGGQGSLAYDNTTGVITYTGPADGDIRGLFSVAAGSGLTYNNTTGEFGTSSIPNSQLQNSSVTIGSTAVALGSTATTISGLLSISSTGITTTDSGFRVQDNVDSSKQLAFECSGITTATTRTLTVPDETGTIATQDFTTAIAIALG
jgi:hypothetical protein